MSEDYQAPSGAGHPITPPPELVEQWTELPLSQEEQLVVAARWGADQELKACCEWHDTFNYPNASNLLRAARRPKPPSPKEEALQVLEDLIKYRRIVDPEYQALRHALEQIDD